MSEYKDWSDGWIREGYYVGYIRDNQRIFEHVIGRDWAHYEYTWPEAIASLATSGPFIPADLEITKGYDASTNTNQIWQMIFGIKGQVYIYIELPTDIHRHGLPKRPKPSSDLREVSHFEEYISNYHEPSFISEHFLLRPDTQQIAFDAYNPNAISMTPELNIMLNKMILDRIGTVEDGKEKPARPIYTDILDKLYKKLVPCRWITPLPVRAPAEAPAGE